MFPSLEEFNRWVMEWVGTERAKYRSKADPLSSAVLVQFAPYFHKDLLLTIRVQTVEAIPIPVPTWLAVKLPPNNLYGPMGVSLVDTILLSTSIPKDLRMGILFHECVHVCQQSVLGIEKFTELYVGDLIQKLDYQGIRAEVQAHRMQGRFEKGEVFEVEKGVRHFFHAELNG